MHVNCIGELVVEVLQVFVDLVGPFEHVSKFFILSPDQKQGRNLKSSASRVKV